jgi:hypothetical protein
MLVTSANTKQKLEKQGPEMLCKHLLQKAMSETESDSKLHQNKNTKHFSSLEIQ